MRILTLIVGVFLFAACGPLSTPMFHRLQSEEQIVVDGMWSNMLTNRRLARETLLDTLVSTSMFHLGVDRATFHSEKRVGSQLVIMNILYDRARPADDVFVICIYDQEGRKIRDERFSRNDVDGAIHLLWAKSVQESSEPKTPEEQTLAREIERRIEAVIAATQPASGR